MCFYVQCRQAHNDALIRTRDEKREAASSEIIFISILKTTRAGGSDENEINLVIFIYCA